MAEIEDPHAAHNAESAAPPLSVGDVVRPHGYGADLFTVAGFRAGGMLVDCVRHADSQEFCVPRCQDVGGWLTAQHIDGYGTHAENLKR